MKNYNQFLNEANHLDNFIFAIDIRNTTNEDINKIIELAIEYFDNFLEYNQHQISDIERYKPWCIVFNMYKNLSINGKQIRASLTKVTNPSFGTGYKYMEDIITAKEFLENGFHNIEEYIRLKKTTDKYNL